MSETMKLSPIIEKRIEPFREPECATIRVPVDCIPQGAKLVEAYETETEIIICGDPPDEPEGLTSEQYDAWCETAHNCDAMGCATFSHVIYRFDKTEIERLKAERDEALALAREATDLGSAQAEDWDRFWAAMGVLSSEITVDQAIEKYQTLAAELEQKRECERMVEAVANDAISFLEHIKGSPSIESGFKSVTRHMRQRLAAATDARTEGEGVE